MSGISIKKTTITVASLAVLAGVLTLLISSFGPRKNTTFSPVSNSSDNTVKLDQTDAFKDMTRVKGGIYERDQNGENVKHKIKSFAIDKNLVTVADFIEFVKATNYKTEAEDFGNAAVFDFDKQEWSLVEGAYYLYPQGPSGAKAKPDHPVTQVSWNDAQAFAKWKNKRLPTSAEWEWAALSGGAYKTQYSWGNEISKNGKLQANHWQGKFPVKNTVEDGYLTTSPVGAFGANPIGLTDMGGNVWQWCSDTIAPTAQEAAMDPAMRRVTKGGSFLCDPKVCHGFRIAGSSSSTPETALIHTGFRCVKDL